MLIGPRKAVFFALQYLLHLLMSSVIYLHSVIRYRGCAYSQTEMAQVCILFSPHNTEESSASFTCISVQSVMSAVLVPQLFRHVIVSPETFPLFISFFSLTCTCT